MGVFAFGSLFNLQGPASAGLFLARNVGWAAAFLLGPIQQHLAQGNEYEEAKQRREQHSHEIFVDHTGAVRSSKFLRNVCFGQRAPIFAPKARFRGIRPTRNRSGLPPGWCIQLGERGMSTDDSGISQAVIFGERSVSHLVLQMEPDLHECRRLLEAIELMAVSETRERWRALRVSGRSSPYTSRCGQGEFG